MTTGRYEVGMIVTMALLRCTGKGHTLART